MSNPQVAHLTLPTVTEALFPKVAPGINPRPFVNDRKDDATVPSMPTLRASYSQAIRARMTLVPILDRLIEQVDASLAGIDRADPTRIRTIRDLEARRQRMIKTRDRIYQRKLEQRFAGFMQQYEIQDDAIKTAEAALTRQSKRFKYLPKDFSAPVSKTRRRVTFADDKQATPPTIPTMPTVAGDITQTAKEFEAAAEGKLVPVKVQPNDLCPYGHGPLVEVLNQNYSRCDEPGCNYTRVMYKSTTDTLPYGQIIEINTSSYKSTGHMTGRMANVIGCRKPRKVNPNDYDILCRAAFKAKIPLWMVDVAAVSHLMRRLQMSELYKYEFGFASELSGLPMPQLTNTQLERMRIMHMALKEPYERAQAEGLTSASNYYNFKFIVHKILMMLGLVEYLPGFPLQSGKAPLKEREELYAMGCKEYEFEYISDAYDERDDPERLLALARIRRKELIAAKEIEPDVSEMN